MGLANYAVVAHGKTWVILHDGEAEGDFETKEAALNRRCLQRLSRSGRGMRFTSVCRVAKLVKQR
jgi:hypothetical protein